METAMHLFDYIDRSLLQDLQNAFAESVGACVVVADPRGNPITAPSGWNAPRGIDGPDLPARADGGHPELPPAAVMILVAEACLGQWVVGDTPPQAGPSDVRSLVFMPLETDREAVGALGFTRGTLRDWPPEALARFGELSRAMAEHFAGKAGGEKWGFSSSAGPIYGKPAPHPGMRV